MKHVLLSLIVLAHAGTTSAQTWSQMSPFPGSPRHDGASFTLSGIAYFGTGLDDSLQYTRDFYALDINNENWFNIASLPEGKERKCACSFTSGSKGYIFGGEGPDGYLNDLWRYDPALNAWQELSSLPDIGRAGAACFAGFGRAYISGGRTDSITLTAHTWRYLTSGNSWVQVEDHPDGAFWRAAYTVVNNLGVIGMGEQTEGGFSNTMRVYVIFIDQWSDPITPFPGAGRSQMVIAPYSGNLYAFGGSDVQGIFYNDLWRYNLDNYTWQQMNPMPSFARRGGMGASAEFGYVYSTGQSSDFNSTNETWKAELVLSTIQDNGFSVPTVYPNPVRNEFRISGLPQAGEVQYALYSPTGQLIKSGIYQESSPIDCSGLNAGLYMVRVAVKPSSLFHNEVSHHLKLVVER